MGEAFKDCASCKGTRGPCDTCDAYSAYRRHARAVRSIYENPSHPSQRGKCEPQSPYPFAANLARRCDCVRDLVLLGACTKVIPPPRAIWSQDQFNILPAPRT